MLSEGAGMLVFEELEHAKARGAEIYAEVLGYGASADGGHITQPDEHGTGAAKAMELRLGRWRKLDPTDIGYINAHGTSTPLGDQAETVAIKARLRRTRQASSAFPAPRASWAILLGASGGVELVLSRAGPARQRDSADDQSRQRPIPTAIWTTRRTSRASGELQAAMTNSFGFGGHNASVIVGQLRNG